MLPTQLLSKIPLKYYGYTIVAGTLIASYLWIDHLDGVIESNKKEYDKTLKEKQETIDTLRINLVSARSELDKTNEKLTKMDEDRVKKEQEFKIVKTELDHQKKQHYQYIIQSAPRSNDCDKNMRFIFDGIEVQR